MSFVARVVRGLFLHVPERWQVRLRSLPVVHAAAQRVTRATSPVGERTWVTVRRGPLAGARVRIDPRFERFVWAGEDELAAVAPRVAALLEPGGVFYDVGAHSGLYSLLAARRVGPAGRVYAFEPDAANAARAREHVAANGADAIVDVVEAAVWSRSVRVGFAVDVEHALRDRGHVAGDGVGIDAVALDDYAATHRPPDMIKIDVEGGEQDVLRGAARVLAEVRPIVVCEVHPVGDAEAAEATAVDELLREAGYATERVQFKPQVAHVFARPT